MDNQQKIILAVYVDVYKQGTAWRQDPGCDTKAEPEGVQTVKRETNPLYYRSIELFGQALGYRFCSTQASTCGAQPIVTTLECLKHVCKSDIDTLYMKLCS